VYILYATLSYNNQHYTFALWAGLLAAAVAALIDFVVVVMFLGNESSYIA